MSPKISVIMSIYNEPVGWIHSSINSILTQTFKNFEYIIICDNPENNDAINYVRKVAELDKRVIFIVNDNNIGLTKSLNKGILLSKGEYIARMDADDIALLDRFENQINVLEENPSIDVCATNTDIINEEGDIILYNNYKSMLDISWLFIDNPIAHSSVIFRKKLIKLRNPFYNEEFRSSQDFELWSFLIVNGINFYIHPKSYLLYRKSSGQISQIHKYHQTQNSIEAHRKLILDFLSCQLNKKIFASKASDIIHNCKTILHSYNCNKRIIYKIVYIAYLSLCYKKTNNRIKYIFDRDFFIFRLPIKFSIRILSITRYKGRIEKYILFD